MAESRDVRLYIYNDNHQKGKGLSLIESQTFQLEDTKNVYTEKSESVDPVSGAKILTEKTTTYVCSFDVTLTKLEYKKKVYEPCQILANLQVGVVQERTDVKTTETTTLADGKTNVEEKTEKGHFKPVEMIDSEKINLLKGASVELEIDNNKVAQNYFIYKVRSSYRMVSGKTSLFVELTIFSRDKLMTLDKYSRAYTARKLYSDILSDEAKKFSSVEVANHMQLLKYQDSSTKATSRDELRIPYLVQYNESFYQFMVRSANRFGEFLFFEDGQLNLGMQPSEKNYYKRNDKGEIEKKDGADIIIDWATEPNAVQNRYYESVVSEGISVEERGHSYLDHTPEYEDAYGSSDGRYNPDPTSANEWTDQDLEKNKYIEYDDALNEDFRCYGFEMLFKSLESSTIGEATTELVLGVSKWLLDVHKNNQDYNNVLDDANFDTIENEDQKSGDNYKQFVTYSGSTNLSNNLTNMFKESGINNFTDLFYRIIRQQEKEVGEQAVWLDFGNYYKPIKLGDKLRVANKDYVAISVEGSYENGQEHLLVSAIPVYSLSTTTPTPQAATTAGDPWTSCVPLPPALPDVLIRDARPQVAFVAEILDPGTLGRIRVRYPWQDEDGDMSPWIRVTLPLATQGGAVNFTPSVGDEVMVGYVHGNIEHPYGMGYLTAPFVNERWKNAIPFDQYGALHGIKVKTGHHLTFSDGANAASFVASIIGGPFNAVKNFWPTGLAGAFPLGDEISSDFGGGFELADRYGFYKISGSSDDRNITIQSPLGTVNLNAFQGISIEAPNGDIEIKGKNVSIEAGNRLSIKSGENIENKLWYKDGWKGVAKTGILSTFGTIWSHKVENWLDISFLRCLFEWFFIPVNGTLSIKSSTFVTIEAGEGQTDVPQESLRYGKGLDDKLENSTVVYYSMKLIPVYVKYLMSAIYNNYTALCNATSSFNKMLNDPQYNANEQVVTYSTIIKKGIGKFTVDSGDFNWDASPLLKDGELADNNRKKFVEIANNIRNAANNLKNVVNNLSVFSEASINIKLINPPKGVTADKLDLKDIADEIKTLTIPTEKGVISLDSMKNQDYTVKDVYIPPTEAVWENMEKAMTRYAISKYLSSKDYLSQDKSIISSVNDAYNNEKWKKYVKSVEINSSFIDKVDSFGKDELVEIMNPLPHLVDDQLQWSHGFEGKILMSDQSDKTAFFDKDLNMKPHHNRVHYEQNVKDLRKFLNEI